MHEIADWNLWAIVVLYSCIAYRFRGSFKSAVTGLAYIAGNKVGKTWGEPCTKAKFAISAFMFIFMLCTMSSYLPPVAPFHWPEWLHTGTHQALIVFSSAFLIIDDNSIEKALDKDAET